MLFFHVLSPSKILNGILSSMLAHLSIEFFCYITNLHLHFQTREQAAIRELVGVAKDTGNGGPLEGAHVHIVHLSDSSASLDMIKVIYTYS